MSDTEMLAFSIWFGTMAIAVYCERPSTKIMDSVIRLSVSLGWLALGGYFAVIVLT